MKDKIVVIGMPGSGKTTLGKILSKQLSMKFVDVDEYIEKSTGKKIKEIFENGEEYFRNIETEACRELVNEHNIFISTGGGVIKKPINIEILGKEALIIFIDRPINNILEDVNVSDRPLLKDGKEKLISLYKERYELYKNAAHKTIINDKDIDEFVKKFNEEISGFN